EGVACCPLCGGHFRPGATRLGACRRELAEARRRERARPIDAAVSLAVFGATALVLLRALGGPPAWDPFGNPAFWLLPAWVTVLIGGAWLGFRADRGGAFQATRATALTLLASLVAPLVLSFLPLRPPV